MLAGALTRLLCASLPMRSYVMYGTMDHFENDLEYGIMETVIIGNTNSE